MIKHRLATALASVVILLSFLLAGCSGITQEQYDALTSQYQTMQSTAQQLQVQVGTLTGQKDTAEAELATTQGKLETTLAQLQTTETELETAQDELEATQDELETAQDELETAQDELETAQDELEATQDELETAQGDLQVAENKIYTAGEQITDLEAQIADLEAQLGGLEGECDLVGATKAETAANIVRFYYETHIYSAVDEYVCGDMAMDVWDMLKAHGIASLIVIGDVDIAISDILLATHAWVLAEVAPGQYLALEATGGYTVLKSENPLYYQGWAFDSPAGLKSNDRLFDEYNVRVVIYNEIVDEDNAVLDAYEASTVQAEWEKLYAVHLKLLEILDAQEAELYALAVEMNRQAIVVIID